MSAIKENQQAIKFQQHARGAALLLNLAGASAQKCELAHSKCSFLSATIGCSRFSNVIYQWYAMYAKFRLKHTLFSHQPSFCFKGVDIDRFAALLYALRPRHSGPAV